MTYKVNSWTEFQPLKTLMVGSVYKQSFFDGIKNDTIREGLKEIVGSTEEDIDNFKKVIKDKGIELIQYTPDELGYKSSILDYIDNSGRMGTQNNLSRDGFQNGIPIPPLAVRDDAIVMGNKFLITDPFPYQMQQALPEYKKQFANFIDTTVIDEKVEFSRSVKNIKNWAKKNRLQIEEEDIARLQNEQKLQSFCAPNLTRLGKKILVDVWQAPHIIEEFLEKYYPEYDYQKIFIGGHNDSVFTVLRPGLVIASEWLKPYADIFKDWDIIWFYETDWQRVVNEQVGMKYNNSGSYWFPEKENNEQLENFINNWLSTWHGYSEETIFDVNVLMLDENTCIVNSNSSFLLKELEKRKIDPIVVPLRNRFFWDGGWHCNTLDIYREGNCEDYGL